MKNLNELKKRFGTVTFESKELILTQDAHADNYGTDGDVRYYAHAVDKAGNEYRVVWETTEIWKLSQELYCLGQKDELTTDESQRMLELSSMALTNYDDESNACDWCCPIDVEQI